MDLTAFIGQYIKIFTRKKEWFIGELLKVHTHGNDQPLEYVFNCVSSIKDQNRKEIYKGIRSLNSNEIAEIEELAPQVQEGIRLTVTNVPSIVEAYHSMTTANLPRKVSFGKIEEQEER